MMISVPSGQQRRWFEAGEAWLAIDTDTTESDAPIRTLEDAVLLHDHDPLLQCLASWCGDDFEWTPASADKFEHVAVTVQSRAGRTLTAGLGMPDELLESLPPFPERFAELVRVGWHRTKASLLLDQVTVSAFESTNLQPGSLLLLPGSFAELWQATLRFDQPDDRAARVYVQPATGMLSFDGWDSLSPTEPVDDISLASNVTEPASVTVDVFLESRVPIDLNDWLEASESGSALASTDGFFRRSLRITAGSQTLSATLMIVGDGYGALIDSVE